MSTTLEQLPTTTPESQDEDRKAVKEILHEIDNLSPEDRQTVIDWLRETDTPKDFTIGNEPMPVAEQERTPFVDPGYVAAREDSWQNTDK